MPTCPQCGAELQADARYCIMCGARVRSAESEQSSSSLTSAGVAVAIATATLCAAIVVGAFFLVQSML